MSVLKKRLFETSKRQNCGKVKVYRPQNLAPRIEFRVESESEVQNDEFRAPGGKNWKNRPAKKSVFDTFMGLRSLPPKDLLINLSHRGQFQSYRPQNQVPSTVFRAGSESDTQNSLTLQLTPVFSIFQKILILRN